ncbi:helix-turn-helix domain-containing protein [Chryseobacterium sp. LAM-KRS1]|uniref:helix-turn-helix domain-containing protein n=1 Tax=Chryseobacterium sp. LAM-KRS1 TaxID=2715754 RepID=UPI001554ED67|nr:helix-turn-helix domain-containing protein [Chryseobacterium sp. LAM-KRS1]
MAMRNKSKTIKSNIFDSLKISKVNNQEHIEDFTIINLRDAGLSAPYTSYPFRSDDFIFIFIKEGNGKIYRGNYLQEVQPLSVHFINTCQQIELSMDSLDDIYMIIVGEYFFKKYIDKDFYRMFTFLIIESGISKESTPDFFSMMEDTYIKIYNEFKRANRNYHAIGHLVGFLLHKFTDEFWIENSNIHEEKCTLEMLISFKRQLSDNFIELINGKTEKVLKLSDFASSQNIHPKHFNTIIKNKTGKTVSEWITEKSIDEAKILLRESNLSIKEISNLFGYSEPTHFSHFFKKNTKMSPKEYREGSKMI